MSPASARSSVNSRRVQSLQPTRRLVEDQDAYSFVLRTAYLSHLLQPKARRTQQVTQAPKPISRSSTSIQDLVKDFSLIRDSKSTRFPHGFTAELDKRITGVLVGKERMPEYNDALVKRTFATFLNEFKNPTFRKSMEKDRRVEDLLLIFFSKATSELQKGKTSDDDAWKLMVDRHVALFVRLISSTLKKDDWARDRPELTSRLQTLESKLLVHAQDLTSASQGSNSTTIEVEVPRSSEVKDMPLVLFTANIFNASYDKIQADIDSNKAIWTEQAAVQDLKLYQMHLSLNSSRTLNSQDFQSEDAFEAWRKAEVQELSQLMLAIIQANPELAKSTTGTAAMKSPPVTSNDDGDSSYVADQSFDMSTLSLNNSPRDSVSDDTAFTFIPSDPRIYYRAVLKKALNNDIHQDEEADGADGPDIQLLSKRSIDVLNELALRWRIPQSSRMALFLDVIREKFDRQDITLETLDAAFMYTKTPPTEAKKANRMSQITPSTIFDPTRWTIADYSLHQQSLSSIHDALLRELFELLQHCYEPKPPSIGPAMYILENHIYDDPLFSKTPEDLDEFTVALQDALKQRAQDAYNGMLSKHVPEDAESWEFYHVIQLGKAVVTLADKIQKRYRKNPEIMG